MLMARLEDSRQTLPHKKKAARIGTTKGSVKAARLKLSLDDRRTCYCFRAEREQ